ncbi:MAG: DNA translocase FtsK [Acetobacter sp.]|nr:DNA translocase FtsK [Acetobacter sp.]
MARPDQAFRPSGGLSGFRRSLVIAGGVGIWLLAVVLILVLWSYNPADPSWNTSTTAEASNFLGWPGAYLADSILQNIGMASALIVLAMVTWGWRLIRHQQLSKFALRFVLLVVLLPLVGALFAALPQLFTVISAPSWPTEAGMGGGLGLALATAALGAASAVIGPAGGVIVWFFGLIVALILGALAFGLDKSEWKAVVRSFVTSVMFVGRQSSRGMQATVRKMRESDQSAEPVVKRSQPISSPVAWRQTQEDSWNAPVAAPSIRESGSTAVTRMAEVVPSPSAVPAALQSALTTGARSDEESVIALSGPGPASAPVVSAGHRSIGMAATVDRQETVSSAHPVTEHVQVAPSGDVAEKIPPQKANFLSRLFKAGEGRDAEPSEAKGRDSRASEGSWKLPPVSLLRICPPEMQQNGPTPEMLHANARLLETVLSDFGVQGRIVDMHPGPVVTLYELEPAPGIRAARVIGLADDVARSLSVLSVRIATVPGRNVMGIEVPNEVRETVYLSELFLRPEWTGSKGILELALGKDIAGAPIFSDLAKMPHLLVAGTTGSGKSVGVNAMILSLLFRHSADECRLILIDPKVLELSIYDGIPHLLTPVVTEPQKAVAALKWVVREMDRRYRNMAHLQVRNIAGYNERATQIRERGEEVTRRVQTGYDPETGNPVFEEQSFSIEPLPYIVVVIDEMADLMMTAGKEIDAAVQRLAQKARAAGIHVIMATQRPSVDVITGTIKANFPTRISFQVISKFDSRTILGEQGAEQLLGQGDMLFMQGGGRITRVHGPFVADSEVEAVVSFLREQGEPVYDEDVISGREEESGAAGDVGAVSGGDGDSETYNKAVALVIREGKASTSFVQRHLSIGYNRAAKLIEQMEKNGIVTPADHVGRRKILIGRGSED